MNPVVNAMMIPVGTYGLLHTIHWIMSRYYSTYCNPAGIGGFLSSFFISPTPNCTILLSLMEHTSTTYTAQIINSIVYGATYLWKKQN